MVEKDKVSSFDESGYFKGQAKIISSGSLAKEADEQDQLLAALPSGSEISVARILLTVLQEAVLAKASYVHIHPHELEFIVKYRTVDRLWEANAFPLYIYWPFVARLKMISSINIAERRLPQFGRFLYEHSAFLYEFRLSSIPTRLGEAFILNVLTYAGQGDYSVDRHQWLDNLSRKEVLAQINALQQGKPE